MKSLILLLVLGALFGITACTSEPSSNPHPRRTFNAETGNFEGPTPMPNAPGDSSRRN